MQENSKKTPGSYHRGGQSQQTMCHFCMSTADDLVQNAQLFQQLDLVKVFYHILPTHEPLQSELTPPLLGSLRSTFGAHLNVVAAFRPGVEPMNRTMGKMNSSSTKLNEGGVKAH